MRLRRTFLTLISCALLTTLATAGIVAQDEVFGTVYQTTNVRSGPDTRFEIVGQLTADDRVQIDGRDAAGRWLHVLLADGSVGWLPVFALVIEGDVADIPVLEDEVEGTAEPSVAVSVISYGRVNVRGGPGTEYEIVAQLDVDERAEALARSSADNDWLLIRLEEAEGWVAYFTVNVQGDPANLPVLVPDSSGESLIPPSRLIRARFNVRLHDTPELASPVSAIVPFDNEVTALGRSVNGDWLFVGFGEENGWGVAQLFAVSRDEIEALPVYEGIS